MTEELLYIELDLVCACTACGAVTDVTTLVTVYMGHGTDNRVQEILQTANGAT